MILYKYDKRTREYLGYFEAYLDELESVIKGENVYVIPPCSTEVEPFIPKEGYTVVFNGSKWVEVEDNRGLTVYSKDGEMLIISDLGPIPEDYLIEKPTTLKELKELKSNEIKIKYKNAVEEYIDLKGLKVSIKSSSYITKLLSMYSKEYIKLNYEEGEESSIVNRNDLEEVSKYLYLRGMLLGKRKRELMNNLSKLKSKEDVLKFEVNFNVDKEVEEFLLLSIEEINRKF